MPTTTLERRLRHEFANPRLLQQALTHRSFYEVHNERLEFLGDSILNCAVAALLFNRFPNLDEGVLSRVRSNLVKQQTLFEIAAALGIADELHLGEGELLSGGRTRPSILADALEAVIGAVFLDAGFVAAQTIVDRIYTPILQLVDLRSLGKDPKSLLQEHCQGNHIPRPTYAIVAVHGAGKEQTFEVTCEVAELGAKTIGSGANRRAAEQEAARSLLARLRSPTAS